MGVLFESLGGVSLALHALQFNVVCYIYSISSRLDVPIVISDRMHCSSTYTYESIQRVGLADIMEVPMDVSVGKRKQ